MKLGSLLRASFGRGPQRRNGAVPATGRSAPSGAYDVIVVGGGVRALALARACARDGAKVALFAPGEIAGAPGERAWPVARAAHTDRFRMAADARSPKRVMKFASASAIQGGRDRTGCLSVALSAHEIETLSAAATRAKAAGVEAWMVPAREVAALSPPLAAGNALASALYEPGAATVDADAVALALADSAAEAGAELFHETPVTALERDEGGVTGVRLGEAVVQAGAVALADDIAAIRLIREGKGRLSLRREERQFLVTEPGAPAIGAALYIDDVTITRDLAGAITISGPYGVEALAQRALAIAPSLSGLAVFSEEPATIWTGVDGLAQVGAAEIPGLWLALGFGRDALSAALPAAKHIAALLAGRRANPAFEPLAPTRRPVVRREAAQ